jgi:hypothetical protein
MWRASAFDSPQLRAALASFGAGSVDVLFAASSVGLMLHSPRQSTLFAWHHFDSYTCDGLSAVVVSAAGCARLAQTWDAQSSIRLTHECHAATINFSCMNRAPPFALVVAGTVTAHATTDLLISTDGLDAGFHQNAITSGEETSGSRQEQ